mmetsp:Transcript_20565/g.42342  ORF Transcript_20565/g.42342 Transcript_20565/m.42342 type:complete len:85 (-) Transcript_20565:28-282(-)
MSASVMKELISRQMPHPFPLFFAMMDMSCYIVGLQCTSSSRDSMESMVCRVMISFYEKYNLCLVGVPSFSKRPKVLCCGEVVAL